MLLKDVLMWFTSIVYKRGLLTVGCWIFSCDVSRLPKNQKIPHCRNNSKAKYQNREKRQHTNTWRLLFWLSTVTSITIGGVKLVLWTKLSLLVKWCGHNYLFYLINSPTQNDW